MEIALPKDSQLWPPVLVLKTKEDAVAEASLTRQTERKSHVFLCNGCGRFCKTQSGLTQHKSACTKTWASLHTPPSTPSGFASSESEDGDSKGVKYAGPGHGMGEEDGSGSSKGGHSEDLKGGGASGPKKPGSGGGSTSAKAAEPKSMSSATSPVEGGSELSKRGHAKDRKGRGGSNSATGRK
jgi:hypothetical protein